MGLSKEIYVDSEIMPLKKVIVHAPDEGIDRISPKRAGELLFDDIVYLPAMQREHKIFTNVLGMFIGDENVLETETLIREALDASVPLKEELLQKLAEWEELPGSVIKSLNDMDHGLLA